MRAVWVRERKAAGDCRSPRRWCAHGGHKIRGRVGANW